MSIINIPWENQNNQYLITGLMSGPKSYIPHAHSGGEIYLHIAGDVEYVVENRVYCPKPYDVILAREHELHHLNCKSSVFDRIVIEISDCFFLYGQHELYHNIFCNSYSGYGNLIPAATAKSSGIYSAILRTVDYLKEEDENANVAALGALSELMYLFNKVMQSQVGTFVTDGVVRDILQYIDQNVSEPIRLDDIANYFYISKPHLCRVFKLNTGLTINKYIIDRRISLVERFVQDGKNFAQACNDAGFGSYSNFYKIYVKKTGKSPREKLLKPKKK